MVSPSWRTYTLGYDDHDSFQLFQLCRFACSSAQHPFLFSRARSLVALILFVFRASHCFVLDISEPWRGRDRRRRGTTLAY